MKWFLQLDTSHPVAHAAGGVPLFSTVGQALGMVAGNGADAPESSGRGSRGDWPWCLIALVVSMLLATGCATSGSGARTPRPGHGLREYERLVLDLRQDVTQTGQALEALAAATQRNSGAAYARFDESLQRLEVVSIKARARVEAMEKRGEAYFEEWAEEISAAKDEASRRAAEERFAELHLHFEAILKDTGQVRQAFRPFLEGSRRLRTTLGPKPTFEAVQQAKPMCAQIVADGQQGREAMDQLLKTLQTTEVAVMAGPVPSAKPGGRL